MTMDKISVMCRNSVLRRFLAWIISKVQIFLYLLLLMAVNVYKHMALKSWSRFYKVVQLHKSYSVGKLYILWLQISYSVYMPKNMKIGLQ